MGQDRVRHVRVRKTPDGLVRHFWEPTRAMRKLGYSSEPLGTDQAKAYTRAVWLNSEADKDRMCARSATGQDLPATAIKRLVAAYEASDEFPKAARSRRDYSYWLGLVVESFGKYDVALLGKNEIKVWLKATPSDWNRFHLALHLRTFLKWCVEEEYIKKLPKIVATKPPSRKVRWEPGQIIAAANAMVELKRPSLAIGFLVEWCIGQNPCDVWSLPRSAYANRAIDVTRSKTGVGGDPIPLWPDIAQRLDAYLADSPATPEAALFRDEKTGKEWKESTRAKWFARARAKAGLPKQLQMRDLRRTAITEALKLFNKDQVRALSRHATTQGMEPYDALDRSGIIVDIQSGRQVEIPSPAKTANNA